MPDFITMLMILGITGVISSGITQIVKTLISKRVSANKDEVPYWNAMLRAISMVAGGLVGILFGGFPWGVLLGVSGGVLAAYIYKKVRDLVKSYDPQ